MYYAIIAVLAISLITTAYAQESEPSIKDTLYDIKSKYYQIHDKTKSSLTLAEDILSKIELDSKASDHRWDILVSNNNMLNHIKKIESSLEKNSYINAYNTMLTANNNTYTAKDNLYDILKIIKEYKIQEEQHYEKTKNCFLFWCDEPNYTIKDSEISKFQNSIESISYKTLALKISKSKDIFHTFEITQKNNDIQKLEQEIQSQQLQQQETTKQNLLDQQKMQNQLDQKELEPSFENQITFGQGFTISDEFFQEQQQRLQKQLEQDIQKQEKRKKLEQQRFQDKLDQQQMQSQLDQQRIQDKLDQQRTQSQLELQEHAINLLKEQIRKEAITNPVMNGIIKGIIYFYIEPIPSYYEPSGINTIIDNISDTLEGNFYNISIQRTYNENSADIVISWIRDFGSKTLGHAVFKQYIEVSLGSNNCWGEWQAFDSSSVGKIMWHEIGHTLGYGHSSDSDNIMYHSTSTQFYKDIQHKFLLEKGYSKWFMFCSTNVTFVAKNIQGNTPFDVFAIPPETPKDFSKIGGKHYTKDNVVCGSKNVVSIIRNCNVEPGAYLHFTNNANTAIQIEFLMMDNSTPDRTNMDWDENYFKYTDEELLTIYKLFH